MFAFSTTVASGNAYSYSQMNTKAAAFETANGESILAYYSPACKGDSGATVKRDASSWVAIQPFMCANFVYDLNGTKGPNTVGKDIGFISVLYPTDSVVVAPIPNIRAAGSSEQRGAGKLCQQQDSESRMPNKEEMAALFYNKNLIGAEEMSPWTSSMEASDSGMLAWSVSIYSGRWGLYDVTREQEVWCIKR